VSAPEEQSAARDTNAKIREVVGLPPDPQQIAVPRAVGKRIDSCMEESESDRARRQGCLFGGIDCHELADQFIRADEDDAYVASPQPF